MKISMRVVRLGSIVVLALAAPVTLTANGEIKVNECDAQLPGTCCPIERVSCQNPGPTKYVNYCYRASGACSSGADPCVNDA